MKINSESEMLQFGENLAREIPLPAVIELVGDVGAGKTTLVRGLAAGLGVVETVTSPSFTISKRYDFEIPPNRCESHNAPKKDCCENYNTQNPKITDKCCENNNTTKIKYCENNNMKNNKNHETRSGELIHYDFYRLNDPGIMRDELSESLENPTSVVAIEWGGEVSDLLPGDHLRLEISQNADGSREISANNFLKRCKSHNTPKKDCCKNNNTKNPKITDKCCKKYNTEYNTEYNAEHNTNCSTKCNTARSAKCDAEYNPKDPETGGAK